MAVPYRRDAFRAVCAVRIGTDLWVVHAFQKKSTQGIETPKHEIDVVRERLKRLREQET
ncbi:type II toxin-antitoxin system RelE/ParE family toxin [Rhodoplanes sp. TEM]|uniref:Type II toxin-antitoxin system RelE/ParE family toxin n=1 Tax=Rhodoplanes tepidamans TaxID=200616 RepID=A0ABT5JHS0_RHOTP|nr:MULTISPECIES: type II toxin-antitoxin system RelE/ParE family toxin [Rhodoplanes]MDC7789271.1 type II toxin-antitoxin system RelE/ParE family toxin [Rhodoplanes tepidamans]MDC7987050.1 type II toxin-antitoxin system RelE/ParE family toxin [Rhodoplanes sp. TEM]